MFNSKSQDRYVLNHSHFTIDSLFYMPGLKTDISGSPEIKQLIEAWDLARHNEEVYNTLADAGKGTWWVSWDHATYEQKKILTALYSLLQLRFMPRAGHNTETMRTRRAARIGGMKIAAGILGVTLKEYPLSVAA